MCRKSKTRCGEAKIRCSGLIYLVSFLIVLGLADFVSAADPNVSIPAAGSKIKPILDGVVDDIWSLSTKQYITTTLEGTAPTSPADCSGSWYALWDMEYLYVLIDVNDEALVQDSDVSSGWDDDRVEVFVDCDNSKGTAVDGVNDYQYCFRWNNGQVETPVEWYFLSSGINKLEGVKYAVATTNYGYIFEIALPWSTMIGEQPQEGQLIGIEIYIDDDDDGGARDTQMSCYTEAGGAHHDPSKWGTALLVTLKTDEARNPSPADNAIEVPRYAVLRWSSGQFADKHNVYFGKDFNDVNEADIANPLGVLVHQNYNDTSYAPASLLDFNRTYYWRIDEVNDLDPNSLWRGNVWSFTVVNYIVLDDFEGYDDVVNKIFDTWIDCAVNNTGMTVGHTEPGVSFAERIIVHSGRQAMYMRYDNDSSINEGYGPPLEIVGAKLYSEAEREWADPQDWTQNGANSLMIWYRGIMASVGSFTPGTPMRMTAAGADIWGTSDQFHFAFKRLSGNGEISARVVSLTNTNASAKAGVMIRETLNPDSKHIMVVVQPNADNGVAFQRRLDVGMASEQIVNLPGMTAPRYVKLVRSGNTFTASQSSNGMSYTPMSSVTMPMPVDVYVGLCLTSHNANAVCTAEFSSVKNPGTGNWQSQDIGIKSNIAEQLYVVLQDSAGNNSPPVKNSDPLATTLITYTPWNIPFADFAGVNLKAIKKMIIGVGDRNDTQPRSSGDLYIDDIRLYLP